MLRKIYTELVTIRKEIQAIRNDLERIHLINHSINVSNSTNCDQTKDSVNDILTKATLPWMAV